MSRVRWIGGLLVVGLLASLLGALGAPASADVAFDLRLDPVTNADRYLEPGERYANLWFCITEPAYVQIEVLDAGGALVATVWDEHLRPDPLCADGYAAPQWNTQADEGGGVATGVYTVVFHARTEAGETDVETVQVGVERQQILALLTSPPYDSTVHGVTPVDVQLTDGFRSRYELVHVDITCLGSSVGSATVADASGMVTVPADTSRCTFGYRSFIACDIAYLDEFGVLHEWGCGGQTLTIEPPLPSEFSVGLVESTSPQEQYHFRYGQPGWLALCASRPTTVDVEVLDDLGLVVRTLADDEEVSATSCDVENGGSRFPWYYDDAGGQPVPDGDYTIRVTATDRSGLDPVPLTRTTSALWHVSGVVPGTFTEPVPRSVVSGVQRYVYVPNPAFSAAFSVGGLAVGCGFSFDPLPPGAPSVVGSWDADICPTGGTTLPAAVLFIDPLGRFHAYNAPIPITVIRLTVEPRVGYGTEHDEGSVTVQVPVDLTMPASSVVSVPWSATDGTATAGVDFDAASGTVVFQPGETHKVVPITIRGDDVSEPDEMVFLRFGHPTNADRGGLYGLGFAMIEDDDSGPRVRPGVAEAVEGVGATLEIPLTLSEPSTETVLVRWRTLDNTAVGNADYASAVGTAVFAPGETSTTVSIEVVDDLVPELDQIAVLSLYSADNATLGGWLGLGFGTIHDDD